ncbi:MAG: hypothetical protein AAFR70_03790, partial [Pseudomonadota bacterium]
EAHGRLLGLTVPLNASSSSANQLINAGFPLKSEGVAAQSGGEHAAPNDHGQRSHRASGFMSQWLHGPVALAASSFSGQ